MEGVSLLPLQCIHLRSSPLLSFRIPSKTSSSEIWRRRSPLIVGAGREGKRRGAGGESGFLDEDGVVKDMDGYLNYLSLEYESVWDTKPAWCQPWTILLTGVSIVALSWLLIHSIVISSAAFALISAWWYIFLYSYPKAYSEMISERRKRVSNGMEDTYGKEKSDY
ncbi:hypothetical protein LUZ60_006331 [Juncus effusus]|nr:hypothetical protein LUZ60_006331 [Juncus effusus]